MNHLALGAGAEFDRIRDIARTLGERAGVLGDDCALIPVGDQSIAVSVDLSVEGVHFRRDWLSAEEIGWRAAAGALSDLAAEGASVIGLLCSVGVPVDTPGPELDALLAGVGSAVAAVGGTVLGGDLSSAPQWVIDVTVLGQVTRPVTRRGALPGDLLWVTGTLGGARAALVAWEAGVAPGEVSRIAFARPEPRVRAGAWLAEAGARAMIDLSDGLAGDVTHLAAASGVRLTIDLDRLPLALEIAPAAKRGGVSPAEFAAAGGEDYELLAALPPLFGSDDALAFQRACGLRLTRIGTVEPGSGVQFLLRGQPTILKGFDHFG